jgi:hypothetical protein
MGGECTRRRVELLPGIAEGKGEIFPLFEPDGGLLTSAYPSGLRAGPPQLFDISINQF